MCVWVCVSVCLCACVWSRCGHIHPVCISLGCALMITRHVTGPTTQAQPPNYGTRTDGHKAKDIRPLQRDQRSEANKSYQIWLWKTNQIHYMHTLAQTQMHTNQMPPLAAIGTDESLNRQLWLIRETPILIIKQFVNTHECVSVRIWLILMHMVITNPCVCVCVNLTFSRFISWWLNQTSHNRNNLKWLHSLLIWIRSSQSQ